MEVDVLSNSKGSNKVSNQVIDMLVDSTLNKHGVKLGDKEIDAKQKEELKGLVDNLRKSVDKLTQDMKEKEE